MAEPVVPQPLGDTFTALPPEIRNNIYGFYVEKNAVIRVRPVA